MDRCRMCGSKEKLWYCYPVPHTNNTGVKLCVDCRVRMESEPSKFWKDYVEHEILLTKKVRKS